MSLEKTFGKVEKPTKEKKLEVVASVDAVVDDLKAYFEKNKYEGFESWNGCREYFNSCMDFLKSFKLRPKIISEFNTRTKSIGEWEAFILYISALIQTSYNQGFNDFSFEKVNAHCFGAYLKGQPKNPIKITTKTLKGDLNLCLAENCSLKTEKLKGDLSLRGAENCLAEIQNYEGKCFGTDMKNCIIKSANLETLKMIKGQAIWGNNRFELKK